MNSPFIVLPEEGGLVAEIPWNARTPGRVMISLALLAVLIFATVQILDRRWWDVMDLVSNGAMVAALAYLGSACLRNQTRVRLNPDDSVVISYGPQPLLPSARIAQQDLADVQAYGAASQSNSATIRRVDLVTRAGRRHPLRVGGCASREDSEILVQALRDFLKLPRR